MKTRARLAVLTLALLASITAAACGDDGDDASRDQPTTTTAARPQRIVSLSPTATEMLFAIGAGKQVVAVDDQSTYPESAPRTDLSALKPNVEAVAAYEPDLVVSSSEGPEPKLSLEKIGIKVLTAPAAKTLDDTYDQLMSIGQATGHRSEAAKVVADMKADIAELTKSTPAAAKGATYYHELDPSYFTATSQTFIGSVYALLGLKNIADAADTDKSGYPQLSAEFIVKANPDFIFLADSKCCQQSADTVKARDGWSTINAVKNGGVVVLDDDIASRWGPRVVDFLELVSSRVAAVKKAA